MPDPNIRPTPGQKTEPQPKGAQGKGTDGKGAQGKWDPKTAKQPRTEDQKNHNRNDAAHQQEARNPGIVDEDFTAPTSDGGPDLNDTDLDMDDDSTKKHDHRPM